MITVHTSIIDSELNHAEVARHFDFIAIEFKEPRNERIQALLTKLYHLKINKFLAVNWASNDRYIALIAKGQEFNFSEQDVTVKRLLDDAPPPPRVILALLTSALPTQLANNSQRQSPWFFASSLHYVVRHKQHQHGHQEIICCKVRPMSCRGIFAQHLQPSTTTFSSREAHFYEGKLVGRARNKPSFDLDNASQTLAKNGEGAYLNLPIFKADKSRAPAYEVSAKSPEKFQRSRLGALTLFLSDFHKAYGRMAKIELRSFQAKQAKLNKRDIDTDYKKLIKLLSGKPIMLIDNSEDAAAKDMLAKALAERGVSICSELSSQDGAILHIVKPKDFYESSKLNDPYPELRSRFPKAAIQSCTNESIHHDNSYVTDELIVKSEIAQGKLLAEYPSLPAELIFMLATKHPDKDKKSSIWLCAQVTDQQLKLWEASQTEIVQAFSSATKAQLQRLDSSKKEFPYVIYDSHNEQLMLLEDTQAIAIPNHVELTKLLGQIEHDRQKTVPISLVHEFLTEHPLGPDLASTLEPLLARALGGQLEVDDVAKVHHRSRAEIAFHEHLAKHGHMLNTSLRGKDGPLGGMRDIWYVPDQGLYCAGSKDSPQQTTENFSHIYHLDHAGMSFPDWFISSLQVWHIRHRNPTKIPFVFKHLHEFQKLLPPMTFSAASDEPST